MASILTKEFFTVHLENLRKDLKFWTVKVIITGLLLFGGFISYLDNRTANHLNRMDVRLDKMDSRLDTIEPRLGKMDSRLDTIEPRLDKMDSRLGKMDSRLDQIEERYKKPFAYKFPAEIIR